MHPFFRNGKQLLIVGLLWSLICLWVIFLLSNFIKIEWWEAAVWISPPMILILFINLSTWYLCRTTSIDNWSYLKTILVHFLSALLINSLWLLLIKLYSEILSTAFNRDMWSTRFNDAIIFFIAVGMSTYLLATLAHYLIMAVEKSRQSEEEALNQQLLASQSRLKALKATINPHFLFNSLNLLGPLMRTSIPRAETVISQLSDFLVYSLRYQKQEIVTIRDELNHISNYLAIESIRLGTRLELKWEIDEQVNDVPVLVLTLLPLVENAIKHGISQRIEGGTLSISIRQEQENICVEVSNPYDEPARPVRGEGLGLSTLRERLSTYYGPKGYLETGRKDFVFHVKLYFPKNMQR